MACASGSRSPSSRPRPPKVSDRNRPDGCSARSPGSSSASALATQSRTASRVVSTSRPEICSTTESASAAKRATNRTGTSRTARSTWAPTMRPRHQAAVTVGHDASRALRLATRRESAEVRAASSWSHEPMDPAPRSRHSSASAKATSASAILAAQRSSSRRASMMASASTGTAAASIASAIPVNMRSSLANARVRMTTMKARSSRRSGDRPGRGTEPRPARSTKASRAVGVGERAAAGDLVGRARRAGCA